MRIISCTQLFIFLLIATFNPSRIGIGIWLFFLSFKSDINGFLRAIDRVWFDSN